MNIFFMALAIAVSFYSYSVKTITGSSIPLSSFAGKKILLVNVAGNSQYSDQLAELEQLYQQHQNNLVVLVFPSNSFGNEPRDSAGLVHLFRDSLQVNYIVVKRCNVTGSGIHAVYRWISRPLLNDSEREGEVNADFQKILIDKDGKIFAHFNSEVSPLDSSIQAAIARP